MILRSFFGERAYSDKNKLIERTNSLKIIFPNDLVYTTLKDGSYPANITCWGTEVTFLKPFEVRNGKIVSELITKARYIWTQDLNDEIDKGIEIYLSNQFGFNVLRSDQEDKIKARQIL